MLWPLVTLLLFSLIFPISCSCSCCAFVQGEEGVGDLLLHVRLYLAGMEFVLVQSRPRFGTVLAAVLSLCHLLPIQLSMSAYTLLPSTGCVQCLRNWPVAGILQRCVHNTLFHFKRPFYRNHIDHFRFLYGNWLSKWLCALLCVCVLILCITLLSEWQFLLVIFARVQCRQISARAI